MDILSIDRQLKRVESGFYVAVSLIMCIAIAWGGMYIGNEFSFPVLYVIPVIISAWFGGKLSSATVAIFAALSWLARNILTQRVYSQPMIIYLDTTSQAILYLLFTGLVATVKRQLMNEIKTANEDFLTKISNSRAFFSYAAMEIARLKRYKEPFTLAYFDVDDFKSINDNYGHNAGDALLVDLARAIRKHIRPTDVVARIGGDEFVVLFLETRPSQAKSLTVKLQQVMKDAMRKKGRDITFSFGVVTFLRAPRSVDDMLKKADDMMYMSKHKGKDAITYFVYR